MATAASGASGQVYKADALRKMMYPRVFSSPLIHNTHIYAIGGCDQMGQPVDSFEFFDTVKRRWTTLQNMPTKRAAPAVGVVGDKIVVVGGVGPMQQPVNAVEMYDIKEKKWTQMESLPMGLLGISSVTRNDKVLCMGGMATDTNPQDFFRSIDLEENKWKALPPMPTPRYATFSFLIGEKLYVIGGRQGKEPCLAFEVYDFTSETWKKLPDVQSKRVFAMYTCSDKYIFSIGGLIQPGNKGFSNACEVFNLETEEWKIGKPLPTRRGDFAIGMVGEKVVCAGGLGNEGKPLEVIEVYNPEADDWSKGPDMPLTHCSCASIVYDGRLYVIGGLSKQGPSSYIEMIYVTQEEEKSQQNNRGKKKQA